MAMKHFYYWGTRPITPESLYTLFTLLFVTHINGGGNTLWLLKHYCYWRPITTESLYTLFLVEKVMVVKNLFTTSLLLISKLAGGRFMFRMDYLILRLGGFLEFVTYWYANSHLLSMELLQCSFGRDFMALVLKQLSKSRLWWSAWRAMGLSLWVLTSCLCPFILFLNVWVVRPIYCAWQMLHSSWYIRFSLLQVMWFVMLYSLPWVVLVNDFEGWWIMQVLHFFSLQG